MLIITNSIFFNSKSKAWFSYVGKILNGLGFHCFPTVPDLPIYRIFVRGLSQTFPIMNLAGLRRRAKLRNLNINVTAFQ